MRETINIKYTLESPDMDFSIDLVFDRMDFSLLNLNDGEKDWTRLAFHKCSHCPLNSEGCLFCPLARAIDSVISKIHNYLSYNEVHAEVAYNNRVVSADITLQRALSSLLGLIIPASGCPHTRYFRPMSRYHLPFADTEEKIYRATTMFLLAQYFIHKKSGCIPTDFSRLENIYSNVHIVNTQICKRLRAFCENDSTLNAITILDTLTVSLHSALKHDLEKFASYFAAFSEGSVPPTT
ncbi:MAG: hypothetical protein WBG28_11205 [Desulfobulbales bacterium]